MPIARLLGVALLVAAVVAMAVLVALVAQQRAECRARSADDVAAELSPSGANTRPASAPSPTPVRLEDIRHVDASTLPASTPAVPQEAPLPHALKTPIPQPGRSGPSVLGVPASPSPEREQTARCRRPAVMLDATSGSGLSGP